MRLTRSFALLSAFASLAVLPIIGRADVTQADFHESLDLPAFNVLGPRLLQNLGVAFPSAGSQLTAANEIANPKGWDNSLEVSFDPTTGILSMTADGDNSYQTITITLDNLSFDNGQVITGITPTALNSAVTNGNVAPTVFTSYTERVFSVNYFVGGEDYFQINGSPSADVFQVQFGSAVPEPGVIALAVGLPAPGAHLLKRFKCWRRA